MNAEQRGGMALNKDFRSKTGNGSVSREGRAIATPTGESCTHLPPSLPPSIFIYFSLREKSACSSPLCGRFILSFFFFSCSASVFVALSFSAFSSTLSVHFVHSEAIDLNSVTLLAKNIETRATKAAQFAQSNIYCQKN